MLMDRKKDKPFPGPRVRDRAGVGIRISMGDSEGVPGGAESSWWCRVLHVTAELVVCEGMNPTQRLEILEMYHILLSALDSTSYNS